MTEKRKPIDWAAIERDYRTGTFSNRELAHRHGCTETAIRKRAKREGWEKDLSEEVRRATAAKLLRTEVRTQVRTPNAREDAAIIEDAAELRASIVTTHRRDLVQIHGLKRILAGRLADVLQGIDPEGPCLGEKESPGDLLERLSRVTARLIPLERQAHSLDKDPGAPLAPKAPTINPSMTAQEAAEAYAASLREDDYLAA